MRVPRSLGPMVSSDDEQPIQRGSRSGQFCLDAQMFWTARNFV